MITLLFHHGKGDLVSEVLRFFTRGSYTHVALLSPGGDCVIDASGATRPKGVKGTPAWLWMRRHPGCVLRTSDLPDAVTVWRLAESQIGKPYDWAYVWGWLFRRHWQKQDKWVCHELIAWACAEAGTPLLDMTDAHFLTPDHLFRVTKPMERD